jgi:hypothetical protein
MQLQMSIREIEEYIQPMKKKIKDLYSDLFDSAEKREHDEQMERQGPLYVQMMTRASEGMQALDQCTRIIEQTKLHVIRKKLSLRELQESANPTLRWLCHNRRAFEELSSYLGALDVEELEPVINAFKRDDRTNAHVVHINNMILQRKRNAHLRIDYSTVGEQLAHRRRKTVAQAQMMHQENLATIRAASARRRQARNGRASQLLKEKSEMAKRTIALNSRLQHLRFLIQDTARKEEETTKCPPRLTERSRGKAGRYSTGRVLRNASFSTRVDNLPPTRNVHNLSSLDTRINAHTHRTSGAQEAQGVQKAQEELPPRRFRRWTGRKQQAAVLPNILPRYRDLHKSRSMIQSMTIHKLMAKKELQKLVNCSVDSGNQKSRNTAHVASMLLRQRSTIGQQSSEVAVVDDIVRQCDEHRKLSARSMVALRRHRRSVAHLYGSLRQKLEKRDRSSEQRDINQHIGTVVRRFHRLKPCFIYGSQGQGRYLASDGKGRAEDTIRQSDMQLAVPYRMAK